MRWLALLLVLAGAPAMAQECPFPGHTPKLVVQLFFSQVVNGRLLSARVWQRFLAETVTPALPDGFTVYDAYGQWMDPRTRTITRELSKVIVAAANDSPSFRRSVDDVASLYRKRFAQQSVGVLTNMGCGAF